MRALIAWRVGLFLTEGEIEVLSVFSLFFNAGGSVCECMCVYTHTHTQTAQVGYLDVSPGVGRATSEESRWTKSRHICILYMCTRPVWKVERCREVWHAWKGAG